MAQTWSNRISYKSKNGIMKIYDIYKKDKNDRFIFDFLDQICLKLDFSLIKKRYYKSCHNYRNDKNLFFILDFLDETWSNWISHLSKNIMLKRFHSYKKNKNSYYFWFLFLIRSIQNGLNWVKLDHIGFSVNHLNWKGLHFLDQMGSNLSTMDQTSLIWYYQ